VGKPCYVDCTAANPTGIGMVPRLADDGKIRWRYADPGNIFRPAELPIAFLPDAFHDQLVQE
jgi:hypothetical protein